MGFTGESFHQFFVRNERVVGAFLCLSELSSISEGVRVGELEGGGEELLEVVAHHGCLVSWGSIYCTVGVREENMWWGFVGEDSPKVFKCSGIILIFCFFHAGMEGM